MDGGHAVFAAIPVANKLHEEAAKHLALVCVKHASVTFESGMLENANEIKPIVWNEPVTFTLIAVIFRAFHFADLFYRNCLVLLCVKERDRGEAAGPAKRPHSSLPWFFKVNTTS